jgi:lysine-N-methylase
MKLTVPNYYKKFKCIAGDCQHNCCIGWEIDIDTETLELYRSMNGALGERLHQSISYEDTPHFILSKDDRCPFLNSYNLCDIICQAGEDALCQICADHPRFRNDYSDRTELGLGLCCEAAGLLILGQTEKVTLSSQGTEESTPEETAFFDFREKVFIILQDRSASIETRLQNMLALCGCTLPQKSLAQWAAFYQGLEQLDAQWNTCLEELKNTKITPSLPTEWDIPCEQAAVYFAYRHLAGALEDGRLEARLKFIAVSLYIIRILAALQLKKCGKLTLKDFVETARLYSAEIEYSAENTEALLNL